MLGVLVDTGLSFVPVKPRDYESCRLTRYQYSAKKNVEAQFKKANNIWLGVSFIVLIICLLGFVLCKEYLSGNLILTSFWCGSDLGVRQLTISHV